MKTGKLLKFHRAGGDIQAYVYDDGGVARANLYLLAPGSRPGEPLHRISAGSVAEVEEELRAWVERHFPRPPG
jgi:hypothetical protein